mgnify:CR=1 FL=1
MKRLFYMMGFVMFLFLQCSTDGNSGFEIRRGTNISHWLSQSDRRGEARRKWFTQDDVQLLDSLGFDHIRIPVDEEQLWTDEGEKEKEAFDLLHSALGWCAEYGLSTIVDLHILRSHHFNEIERPLWQDPKAQDRFVQCWRDLSDELASYPVSMLAYELFNEPVAEDADEWNALYQRALAAVREQEPDRIVIIGSNRWQSVDTFDELEVPENDPNVILSFHFYNPMPLTHHQASWWRSGGEYDGPVQYPGQLVDPDDLKPYPEGVRKAIQESNGVYDREKLKAMLEKPLTKREQTGLPVYCGEWGCLPTVPEQDRLQWYRDMRSIFESLDIPWTTWDYKGDFGIITDGQINQELVDVLLDK